MRTITSREAMFARFYVVSRSARAAAKKAGYGAGTTKRSYELLRRPQVAKELRSLYRSIQRRVGYSLEVAMAEAGAAMMLARENRDAGAMVAAVELRLWLAGLIPPPASRRAENLRRVKFKSPRP